MKEPSVTIKVIVEPATNNQINDENIAAGVIVANQGSMLPTLFTDPSRLLAAYTPNRMITRSTHSSIAHAYAICQFMPVLVCRAGTIPTFKSGKAITKDGVNQVQKIFKKNDVILNESVPFEFLTNPTEDVFELQVGTTVYYAGVAPSDLTEGLEEIKLTDLPDGRTPVEKIVKAINAVEPLFHIELESEGIVNGSYESSLKLYGVKGTTTPTILQASELFEFQYASVSSIDNDEVSVYLFANDYNNIDYLGSLKKSKDNEDLIVLSVKTATRDYEYEGSLDPEYINPFNRNQYIENINGYEGIEFEVVVGGAGTEFIEAESPVEFGRSVVLESSSNSALLTSLDRLVDDDQYSVAFYCPFGNQNQAYLNALVNYAGSKWAFTPIGLFPKVNDAEFIKTLKPAISSDAAIALAPYDVNQTIADFPMMLSLEVAFLRAISYNKSRGCEFAPLMGPANGSLSVDTPSVVLTTKTRESLLDARIMSLIYKRSEGISYLNKNKTLATSADVLTEEQNKRLCNKINRDIDKLMRQFLGQYNTVSTRSNVVSVLNNYFNNNIFNQVYGLDRVDIKCDEENNSREIQASGKLVITIKAVYLNTIYEVVVYHRVFDVANAQ